MRGEPRDEIFSILTLAGIQFMPRVAALAASAALFILIAACHDDQRSIAPTAPEVRVAPGAVGHDVLPASGYTEVDIGSDLGGSLTIGFAVNSSGVAVGTRDFVDAWVWRRRGDFVILPRLSATGSAMAFGINANGWVVGRSTPDADGLSHAVLWKPPYTAGDMTDIGPPAGVGANFIGFAVNDAGLVVGYGLMPDWTSRAFKWSATTGLVNLPVPGGQHSTDAQALFANLSGDVVGWYSTDQFTHGVLWPAAGGAIDLGALEAGGLSQATGIDDDGTVVGWASINGGAAYHLFTWTAPGGIVDRDPSGLWGEMRTPKINRDGLVVGTSGCNPITYSATYGLGRLPSVCADSWGVSDAGQIVGEDLNSATMWVPTVPPNRPPVASAGPAARGLEGAAVGFDGSASTDPDNNIATYSWNFGDGATGSGVAPSHTYADNGAYTVTLTVTDQGGLSSVATTTATITNVAPAVAVPTVPASPLAVGTTVAVSAAFTDLGILDTHTAVITWGDGNTSAGSVAEATGSGSTSGSHAYTSVGVYTVTVTVTDKDGGVGAATATQYVVVYDPSAGFVTGGGWIASPAGAFVANPALTGKATFGFVAKYEKGATVPTGNTQFSFTAAGLSFNSSSYDWLVVAGAKAQFKGTGTINGGGSYRFMLTAIDGDINGGGGVDRFRIRIWDATSGGLVYDNQLGAAETSDASTALGGGSIVIHQK